VAPFSVTYVNTMLWQFFYGTMIILTLFIGQTVIRFPAERTILLRKNTRTYPVTFFITSLKFLNTSNKSVTLRYEWTEFNL
jgi:hypothetical protein